MAKLDNHPADKARPGRANFSATIPTDRLHDYMEAMAIVEFEGYVPCDEDMHALASLAEERITLEEYVSLCLDDLGRP